MGDATPVGPWLAPAALQPWALALIVQRAGSAPEVTLLPAHGLLVATMVLRGQVSWQHVGRHGAPVVQTDCAAGQCHVQGSQALAQRVQHSVDALSVSLLCRAAWLPHSLGVSAAEIRDEAPAPADWWAAAPWDRWAAWALAGNDAALAQAVWRWLAPRCLGHPERAGSARFRQQLTPWLAASAAHPGPPPGIGERRWQRACLHETGLTPIQLRRIWRVHRAASGLQRGLPMVEGGLADWAAMLGYADQAHLSRDMKSLLGTTPRHWGTAHDSASLVLAQRYHTHSRA